jgi:DNA-binding NarL/FixJ family response regulator
MTKAERHRPHYEVTKDRHPEMTNVHTTPGSGIPAAAGPLSALIVARSDQFREGLAVLVSALPQIGRIEQADDLCLALTPDAAPADLLLCDYDSMRGEAADVLRRTKARWPGMRCVVLVEDAIAYRQAQALDADVVLTKGVLAARLLDAIEGLFAR